MFAARAVNMGKDEDYFSKQSLDNALSLWAEFESLLLHDKKNHFFL
jgi:aspartyl aminopeptidase